MGAQILDGKAIASEIRSELRAKISTFPSRPGLGTILVGDDAGSHSYVAGKHRDCAEVGIQSIRIDLPASISERDLLAAINDLNNSPECTGYIVQLPLPDGLNTHKILEAIDPEKDADGLHPLNLGKLVLGQTAPLPCTPKGILELLHRYSISITGAEVVVMGRGITVGRPLSLLLSRRGTDATVTLTHTHTRDAVTHLRRADVVIAAIGNAHFLKAEMIKPGAIVLDVGITRVNGELLGDVHPDVRDIAGALAPMPGGVGPMTRAMLLSNLVEIYEKRHH